MAVKIRLRRMGTKKKVSYRFVVVDSRSPRDGRFIQMVGTYNPLQKPAGVILQEEKIFDWLGKGAVPTQTVHSLFKQVGLMKKWEKMRRKEDVGSLQLETVIKERKRIKKRKKEAGPKTEKEPKPAKTEEKKAEPKPEDEKKTQ